MPLKKASPMPTGGPSGGSALDKRIGNPASEASWNIAALKQNLQEDSAILEATLREANKLLSESGAPPLVDVGGVANKQRLRTPSEYKVESAAATAEHDGMGEGGDKSSKASFKPSAEFLLEMDVSNMSSEPKVVGFTATMSEELTARIKALEKAITKEGATIIKKAVQNDMDAVCRMSRSLGGGSGSLGGSAMEGLIEELENRVAEEEMQKNSALDHARQLQEQMRGQHQLISELQDKVDYIEGTTAEGSDQMRRMETDMQQLREELQVSQKKMRSEEGEKLKLMEKSRKRDLEVGKMKETMDKMTWQLRMLGEERDHMHQTLEETKTRYHELQAKLNTAQEELSKHQNAERVMKRNLKLQMPEEIKRVVRRVEELDKLNRDLQAKLAATGQAKGGDPALDPAKKAEKLANELAELKINHKMVSMNYDALKREQEASERRFETNLRLAENRNRSLFDKTVMYTQKLQGATDVRVAERLSAKSSGNEVMALRRKNMDLLGQLNKMEEALLKAQDKERVADSKCVTLQEKIDLFAMIQKIDISNLSFSSDARTEDDVDRVFMQRSGMIPMLITGARETVGSRGSTAQGRRSRMQSANSNSASFASENGVPRSGRPPTADDAAMVVYRQGEREKERDERPRAQSAASTISEARQEVRSIEVEALEHKIAVTQAKAASEEKARLAAQERAVSLAEQLLDKEKEIANLQTLVTSGEKTLSKSKKPSRDRSIQHDKTLKLQNKMRDIETEMQKYENKLSEKEEECRIKARKIAELLFKLQVEEDSNLRIQDQIIDLKGQIKKKDEEVTRLAAAAHRDRDEPHGSPRSGQNNVAATRQQQQQQPQSSSSVSSRITNQTLIAQQEAQSGHSSPTRSRSLSSRPGSAEAPTSVTSPPQKGKSPMEQPVSPIQRPLSPPVDTSRPNSGQGRPRTSAGSGDRGAAGGGGDQTWAGGHLEGGSAEGPPDVLTMKTISE